MSAEGFFHDAHEVYAVTLNGELWIATFRNGLLADEYVTGLDYETGDPVKYEVRPV